MPLIFQQLTVRSPYLGLLPGKHHFFWHQVLSYLFPGQGKHLVKAYQPRSCQRELNLAAWMQRPGLLEVHSLKASEMGILQDKRAAFRASILGYVGLHHGRM